MEDYYDGLSHLWKGTEVSSLNCLHLMVKVPAPIVCCVNVELIVEYFLNKWFAGLEELRLSTEVSLLFSVYRVCVHITNSSNSWYYIGSFWWKLSGRMSFFLNSMALYKIFICVRINLMHLSKFDMVIFIFRLG